MTQDHGVPRKVVERYDLTFEEFTQFERQVLIQEHLKRYGSIRRFCYGDVLDFACGCGYGAYMLAQNPDVKSVTAVDNSADAIEWAKKHFSHPNINHVLSDAREVTGKFNTLVCLETIEHIKETHVVPEIVDRCSIDNLIISFPDKKTTHYNPHHFHDFVRQDLIDLFPKHVLYHQIRFADSTALLMTRLGESAPEELFRNLRDLS
jgi:2-polyprenyl-3-methyl-5-hydroxy-6-metoxy-1,4-benzoquinol methylase